MTKRKKVLCIVLAALLALALIGGIVTAVVLHSRTDRNDQRRIAFNAPALTGDYAVVAPASGSTQRNVTATVFDSEDTPIEDNPVTYQLDQEVEGVTLQDQVLTVTSELQKSVTLRVTATDASPDAAEPKVSVTKKIRLVKDESLQDIPANPLEKEGWTLFYNDEFDGDTLDAAHWSPYYLRHWTDYDERTKADFFFQDGSLVLRCPEGLERWSSQDGNKVTGIMSFERDHLHKFGEIGSGATYNRSIPTFDGLATKYGYFEIRLKMPSTRDGSHFAWWMVGTQDDQNAGAQLSGEKAPYYGHYSNQTVEFDIIETYLAPLEKMKAWRPVIHPNGSNEIEYLWAPESEIPGDPSSEYHIYGFEWDENGTKFYVDNKLVNETDRSPNYRMMTIFSVYATGGMGEDAGIYPKDTYIDYFRVYKKNEPAKASSIIINGGETADSLLVPASGSWTKQMKAEIIDQFDQPVAGTVKWKLSETVDGAVPTSTPSVERKGVAIDPVTGLLTISAGADLNQDIFVTAYLSDTVRQTVHFRLSDAEPMARRVLFNGDTPATIKAGESRKLSARLEDQYGQELSGHRMQYAIVADLAAVEEKQVEGVTLAQDGTLTVASTVPKGTQIIIAARSMGRYDHAVLTVG